MQFAVQDLQSTFYHRFMAMSPELPEGYNSRLADAVLAREASIIATSTHQPIAGMHRTMTTAWKAYNVLAWGIPETDQLRLVIAEGVRRYAHGYGITLIPQWIQCWANVLRAGAKFDVHGHGGPEQIAGTYYVTGDAPTGHTMYRIASDPEVKWARVQPHAGLLNLFQSDLMHGVTVYEGPTPRISIAFDIGVEPAHSSNFQPLFNTETFQRLRGKCLGREPSV